LLQAKLIKEKNKYKNIIEIEMERKGKFISDTFFKKYYWMLDIYFDDVLQEIITNEIDETNQVILGKIRIEIDYPLFDIEKIFYDCNNIKKINFIKFDTSHIKSLESMFSECNSLMSVNFDTFDTKNVTNMSCLFYDCYLLEELDLSKFKLDNVIDMSSMFYMCKNLKELNFNLAEKNTKKLKDISFLFKGCYSLKNYDLSKFDMSKIEYKEGII
jgi:surface protein